MTDIIKNLREELHCAVKQEKEPESVQEMREILEGLADLYAKKNHDYNNVFDEMCDEEGLAVGRIYIKAKCKRFCNLTQVKNAVKGEGIEDTLRDLAMYAVMTLRYIKSSK